MVRTTSASLFTAVLLAVAAPACSQSDIMRTAFHDYRVVTVADGLVVPWSIAFLPDGDMLVTERPGRLRIIRGGVLLPDPVPGIPEVVARGQGGLLEVLPHPDFASNRLIYISYSKATGNSPGGTTAAALAVMERGGFMSLVGHAIAAATERSRELGAEASG